MPQPCYPTSVQGSVPDSLSNLFLFHTCGGNGTRPLDKEARATLRSSIGLSNNKEMLVSKKLPPMKKASKPSTKSKVRPTKEDEAPMPKAVTSPAERKKHERTAKRTEADRIESGKRLAANYLEQRDGMDEDTARTVVESMDADTINSLIEEANTGVIAKTAQLPPPGTAPASSSTLPAGSSGPDAEEDATPAIDFLTVPALADDDTFPEIVVRCAGHSRTKIDAEKAYKADKKLLDATLLGAGVKKDQPIECVGIKLTRYTGHSTALNEQLLLEAGVSPDIIKKCWKRTEYDDVRIFVPKEA